MAMKSGGAAIAEPLEMARWHALLRDRATLLAMPSAHHKALLKQAYSLHKANMVDADDLVEMLELADAALEYAVEALLDINADALGG